MNGSVDERLAFLDLERIDRDVFRGDPGVWPDDRLSLFGGEVAAQALLAAAATVDAGRLPHSLHGYFLRPGDHTRPVVFTVERDRDGRSFSVRRVAALQDDAVIWAMACSFNVPVEGPEFSEPPRAGLAVPSGPVTAPWQWCPLLDIRIPVPPGEDRSPGSTGSPPLSVDRAWIRVDAPLPDDPLIHAALHVYASDVTAGFSDLGLDGVPPGGPSLDHAVWLHSIPRADDWVIYDCRPARVGGHRGLYTGSAHDVAGNLVAVIAQEMLLRPPREPRP